MKLSQVRIVNYRSIKSLTLHMSEPFQIMVGLNESGKSNILSAMSLLGDEYSSGPDDVREYNEHEPPVEEAYVKFVFRFSTQASEGVYETLKDIIAPKSLKTNLIQFGGNEYDFRSFCQSRSEVTYTADLIEGEKTARYWTIHGASICNGWKKIPDDWASLDAGSESECAFINVNDYPEHVGDDELEDLRATDVNAVVGTEMVRLFMQQRPSVVAWKYSDEKLLPGRINKSVFRASPTSCEPLMNMFVLSGHADIEKSFSDAAQKSKGMTNLLRRVSRRATSYLHDAWPEGKGLQVELLENGENIEAGIVDKYNKFNMEQRSDGFKRFVSFLLEIGAKSESSDLEGALLLFDEPDSGLHPKGVRSLRNQMERIASRNNVVVATHSIFMVDRERPDRHLLVAKQDESTSICSGSVSDVMDEEVVYRALGFSYKEILAHDVIVFEGWRDRRIFQTWLKSPKSDRDLAEQWKKLGLVYSHGASKINELTRELHGIGRRTIIISDCDEASLRYQRKYKGPSAWITYKDLGYENAQTVEDMIERQFVNSCIRYVIKEELRLHAATVYNIDSSGVYNDVISGLAKHYSLDKADREHMNAMIKNRIVDRVTAGVLNIEPFIKKIELSQFDKCGPHV